jgi:TolB protein
MANHSMLYVMDATGANQKRLFDFPVSDFGWSPDGGRLFFISAYENPEREEPAVQSGKKPLQAAIYAYDLRSRTQTRLTGFGLGCSASWSPDGSRLAVSFSSAESSGIYEVSPDGQRGLHLSESATTDVRPVWSPDGKMIAYVAAPKSGGDAGGVGVYLVHADGTNKRRVTDLAAYEVSWSPDGKRLLLQSNGGIELFDLDGRNRVRLTASGDNPLDAAFTPDGRGVIYRSNHEGDWQLYFVGLDGSGRKRITGQLTALLFCLSPVLSNH